MGRPRRGGDVPIPPDHVDGDIDRSRPDPDRAHHILGADGLRDHGGLAGGDAADAAVSSRTLPMTLIGIYLGNRLFAEVSETRFRQLVSLTLIVSGFALLAK
jgi:hypothetical protein